MDMLRGAYARLLLCFGLEEFGASRASSVLKAKNPHLVLYRLWRAGYLVRVSRGVFRAVHPVLLALEWAGFRWRDRVKDSGYLPFLEKLVVRIVEGHWGRLVSIVLFGSVASGRARPESDIDLLVVAEGLPSKYSERLRLFRGITMGLDEDRLKLWRELGIYPLIDLIILTPEEARSIQPFYLDLLNSSVIIYDRGDFMQGVLEGLRRRLRELGSIRVELPDGSWYWVVKPDAGAGEVIEV